MWYFIRMHYRVNTMSLSPRGFAAACLFAFAATVHSSAALAAPGGTPAASAAASVPAHLQWWLDYDACDPLARGRVVSRKATKGGTDVTIRLDHNGKRFVSTVQGSNPKHFPGGTGFCAQDYSGDH